MKELKNGRSKLVKCDGQVLKTIILAKGFYPSELGKFMGYDRTYLNKCIRTNTIGVKAVEKLREYKIMPAMYDADINGLDPRFKEKFHKQEAKEIAKAGGLEEAEKLITDDLNSLKDIPKNKCNRCALRDKETNGPSDCPTCRRCNSEYDQSGCKIGATADTNEEEKSPAEKAINEPGVVKLEFTLDIVKLKAIIKQAVKEAYEEL